ncbi:peptide chain release factor H [Candidatus Uabimicrobium sp. HlEnr_7]|uniref:peptide chain release factor H n=1 Tax=Candidatus Uabimicrobium helgolandensis TaxID=3095367 RepID=UPI003558F3F8
MQVSAGISAPAECCWVVVKVVEELQKEALSLDFLVADIHLVPGEHPQTAKSIALFLSSSKNLTSFIDSWQGTIKWIGTSPFRPNHKRKNWFIDVHFHAANENILFEKSEIKTDVFRASGPGGQHRNKVETAVRVTHVPTGVVATASEQRSQSMNNKLALVRLKHKIEDVNRQNTQGKKNEMWQQHQALERGNALRVYQGKQFRLRREK